MIQKDSGENIKAKLQETEAQESKKEAELEKKIRRKSLLGTVGKTGIRTAEVILHAAMGNVVAAGSVAVQAAVKAYDDSQKRPGEAERKSKILSKKRIDTFEELLDGNEAKDEAIDFIIKEWKGCKGWDKLAGKIKKMEKDEDFVKLHEVQAVMQQNPEAQQKLEAKASQMIKSLPEEKQKQVTSLMSKDGKIEASMQTMLIKAALEREVATTNESTQKPKQVTKQKNRDQTQTIT